MRILMVCLGNICRSPLAEGILQNKIQQRQLDWEVESAGTGNWHIGEPPDPRSVQIARQYGIDITAQRARQFNSKDFSQYDLILAMDTSNHNNILHMAGSEEERQKVRMIMNYVNPERSQSVPDPYWNDDGFEQVFRMLDEACERLIATHAD